MKSLRQLCAGFILTFALSVSAFAGQVNCPGITDEPPSGEATLTGDMPTGGFTEMILLILALI